MINVEGYLAFKGYLKITPVNEKIKPYTMCGEWIYNPETECWYGEGESFPKEICQIGEELV